MSDLSKRPDSGPLTRAQLWARLLLAVIALALGYVGGAAVLDSDSGPPPAATTPTPTPVLVTVPTENEKGDPAPVTTTEKAVEQAEGGELHEGARSERPDGVADSTVDEGKAQQEKYAEKDDLPKLAPLAASTQAGCTTRTVRNYSSRGGVKPRLFVLHYTVSPNRVGFTDVWSIASLFDRPSFAASSHYVIDDAGNCGYIVAEANKAWTQATFNPVSISVEIIATGREGRLAGPSGITKIGRVASDSMKRWGIPLQMGKVSGCRVTRPGLVTHQMLGACGGGHVDISPYSPDVILRAAKRYRASVASASAKRAAERGKVCNDLRADRREFKKAAKGSAEKARALRRVQAGKATAKRIGLDEKKCRA